METREVISTLKRFPILPELIVKHFSELYTQVLKLTDGAGKFYANSWDSSKVGDRIYDSKYLLRGLGKLSRMKSLKQVTIYGKNKTLEAFRELLGRW